MSTVVERFWDKVDQTSDCWNWVGAVSGHGYGNFKAGPRYAMAHRFAYELLVGSIPEGLQIDHLCRNRRCVNPDHLEPVAARENVRRGETPLANRLRSAQMTHCHRGHPRTPQNLYVYGTKKMCKPCCLESTRQRRARLKNERDIESAISRVAA